MSDAPMTARAGFSRIVLPQLLFAASDDELSLLLAGRVGQAFVQRAWNEFCGRFGVSPSPGGEAIATTVRWLGGRVATVVITLPPPEVDGEAALALLVVPARADDGPRRYFALESHAAGADGGASLVEWKLAPDSAGGTSGRTLACGIEPTADVFAAAVEKFVLAPAAAPPAAPQATEQPNASRPWWRLW